jgi:hypothetical protein
VTGLDFLPIAAEKQHIVFSGKLRRTAAGRQKVEDAWAAQAAVQQHEIPGRGVQKVHQ